MIDILTAQQDRQWGPITTGYAHQWLCIRYTFPSGSEYSGADDDRATEGARARKSLGYRRDTMILTAQSLKR